jgi:uncharacterized membrane protein YraQ (UPF0718 family)
MQKSKLSEIISFFAYDSIKILLILFLLIAVIGFLRTYISPKTIKNYLTKQKKIVAHTAASLFGAITPFCSCSSIPIFLSFIRTGVPLGVAFSFLITSPLINEYLVVMMLLFFGWKVTVLYVITGLLIGIISGLIFDKMKLEKYIEKDISSGSAKINLNFKNLKERAAFGINEAVDIVKKLWIWILVGVGIGAGIHNLIPETIINKIIGSTGIFAVPIAVIIGVPLYANCTAILPIAAALFEKGVPLGTALAFMMATAALSFPEAVMLRRAMKLKLILIFFGIVAAGIIVIGYLFNILNALLI